MRWTRKNESVPKVERQPHYRDSHAAEFTVATQTTGCRRNASSKKSTTRALASNRKDDAQGGAKCEYNKTENSFHQRWS
jgi:hypothetical protein